MLYGKASRVVIVVFCLFLCLYGPIKSSAMFIDMQEAQNIVENWLILSEGPITDEMGAIIREIVHYQGEIHGEPGYYMAFLDPNGWVAVPADDSYEAIRAFGTGFITSQDFANSLMPHLLRVDLPQEQTQKAMQALSSRGNGNQELNSKEPRKKRWDSLSENQGNLTRSSTTYLSSSSNRGNGVYLSGISNDIVVPPILGQNNWGQTTLDGFPFYNYQTKSGDKYYDAGCVPLSVGQVIRHFEYPNKPLIPAKFVVSMDTALVTKEFIRSGDVYDWAKMPVFIDHETYRNALQGDPSAIMSQDVAESHRNEISALLHDIGITIKAHYGNTINNITGTSAKLHNVPVALKERFYYENAVHYEASSSDAGRKLMIRAINSNLNMGLPVIIENSMSENANASPPDRWPGHAAVADGYAYLEYGSDLGSAIYHHVNLGFDGFPDYPSNEAGSLWKDMWFDLSLPINRLTVSDDPNFSIAMGNSVGVVFNIMSDDAVGKEIVSGRIINFVNKQVLLKPAMEVVFETKGNIPYTATTNGKGVFAFRAPPHTEITKATLSGSGIKKGDITNFLRPLDNYYSALELYILNSNSATYDVNGNLTTFGNVGNLYYEKYFFAQRSSQELKMDY